MGEEISARLTTLRRHLGERLEERLTIENVADNSALTEQQVYRLEHGLNGTTQSLVSVLQYYCSHGYNLNWIIAADNSRIPMMLSTGTELQQIGELILQISQGLTTSHTRLTSQLRKLGYIPLGEVPGADVESDVPEAEGLTV